MAREATDMKMKKTKGNMYNAKGSPEAAEAEDETDDFKKGGKTKKHMKKHGHHKDGGKVEGHKAKKRADMKERGMKHHHRASGGRTPFTSGHNPPEPAESKKTTRGHESERPSSGA